MNPSVEGTLAASADRPSSLSRQRDGLIKTAPLSESLSPAACTSSYCYGTIIPTTPPDGETAVRKLIRASRCARARATAFHQGRGLSEGESRSLHGRGKGGVGRWREALLEKTSFAEEPISERQGRRDSHCPRTAHSSFPSSRCTEGWGWKLAAPQRENDGSCDLCLRHIRAEGQF